MKGLGKEENRFWCTLCTSLHSYKNSDDWKKHEKEHDTKFFCLLRGPVEVVKGGAECCFCGALNPDNDHLETHNVGACVAAGPPSFKRRYDMISHLEHDHRVSDGKALAEKWKYTPLKQAWSCLRLLFFHAERSTEAH